MKPGSCKFTLQQTQFHRWQAMSQMIKQCSPAEMYFRATLAQVCPQAGSASTLQDLVDILSSTCSIKEEEKEPGWLSQPNRMPEGAMLAV